MTKLPFTHTLAALERIWFNDGARKHGDAWLQRPDNLDMVKADKHRIKDRDPMASNYDGDSGELNAEHELLRLMCRNERRRIRMAETNRNGR